MEAIREFLTFSYRLSYMARALIFKHFDHAVLFKVLNDLPKSVEAKFIDYKQSVLMQGNKVYKMKVDKQQGREWLISGEH